MSPKKPKGNADDYLRMYRQMVRIRAFEDNANQLYLSAKMPGLTHMYSGEEAVAVGICEALTVTDKITSTHRGHGHCVAKGANFKEMFCELLGKEEGYCRGKGGSMHIADQSNGNLGANAIVGGSMGIATGAAFTAKLLGKDDVTVCFFGDGATAQGLMYAVMNMAADSVKRENTNASLALTSAAARSVPIMRYVTNAAAIGGNRRLRPCWDLDDLRSSLMLAAFCSMKARRKRFWT